MNINASIDSDWPLKMDLVYIYVIINLTQSERTFPTVSTISKYN